MNLPQKNIERLKKITKRHDIAVTLYHLKMENGNISKCKKAFENIKEGRDGLPEEGQKFIDEILERLTRQI